MRARCQQLAIEAFMITLAADVAAGDSSNAAKPQARGRARVSLIQRRGRVALGRSRACDLTFAIQHTKPIAGLLAFHHSNPQLMQVINHSVTLAPDLEEFAAQGVALGDDGSVLPTSMLPASSDINTADVTPHGPASNSAGRQHIQIWMRHPRAARAW